MVVLGQYDCMLDATRNQYVKLSKLANQFSDDFVENCVVRGGLFWSENNGKLIAGKLSSGNKMSFESFFKALNNTINEQK